MSIEQKIAELLAESKAAQLEEQLQEETVELPEEFADLSVEELEAFTMSEEFEQLDELSSGAIKNYIKAAKDDKSASNDEKSSAMAADDDKVASMAAARAGKRTDGIKAAKAKLNKEEVELEEELTIDVSADVAALINGEELTEEFKTKAATIFEAAVVNRVKQEVAKLEEEYTALLIKESEEIAEGLIEKVDGYLDYVVEQWIAQNELALEHGMKSEILEGFVAGLKGLFEEHYIDIPEEKFDVVGVMESTIEELEAKLNEQVAANVELNRTVGTMKRSDIVEAACEGLSDTEVEKFKGLAEELVYEDVETFTTKVQTIRESYFTTKAQADVESVVTDAPVEMIVEGKKIDPTMAHYLAAINQFKK